jgi:hypothetical protein
MSFSFDDIIFLEGIKNFFVSLIWINNIIESLDYL